MHWQPCTALCAACFLVCWSHTWPPETTWHIQSFSVSHPHLWPIPPPLNKLHRSNLFWCVLLIFSDQHARLFWLPHFWVPLARLLNPVHYLHQIKKCPQWRETHQRELKKKKKTSHLGQPFGRCDSLRAVNINVAIQLPILNWCKIIASAVVNFLKQCAYILHGWFSKCFAGLFLVINYYDNFFQLTVLTFWFN